MSNTGASTGQMHLRCELRSHEDDVRTVRAFPDGRLATGSRDKLIKVWTESGPSEYTLLSTLAGHTDYVSALAISSSSLFSIPSPAGSAVLISGSRDATVGIWDLNEGNMKHQLKGHAYQIAAVTLDPSSRAIVSASLDGTARVWREGQSEEKVLQGHEGAVLSVSKVPGEGIVATGGGDCTIRMWRLSDGECMRTVRAHSDSVRSLAMIPDVGIVSGSHDGLIKLWNESGECLLEMAGHSGLVYSVAVSSDGTLIASGSEDNTAKIWRVDGTLVQTIEHPGCVWSVDFLPNGDLVTGCSDSVARIWSSADDRSAPAEVIEAFRALVASRQRRGDGDQGSGQNELGSSEASGLPPGLKLEDPCILEAPGANDGQIVVVKEGSSGVAYSWDGTKQEWDRIGEVVAGPSNTVSDGDVGKKWHQGQEWDYVFDVDVADGAPPLKLALNDGENPYDVADRFIEVYDLPSAYHQQIVDFILQNTSQGRMQTGEGNDAFVDPYTGASAYVPPPSSAVPSAGETVSSESMMAVTGGGVDPFTGNVGTTTRKHMPASSYLVFDSPPPVDGLLKKLSEFIDELRNQGGELASLVPSNPQEEEALKRLVSSVASRSSDRSISSEDVTLLMPRLLLKWPASKIFPCLDIVRMILLDSEGSQGMNNCMGRIAIESATGTIGRATFEALTALPAVAASRQVALRCMCNCFALKPMSEWIQGERGALMSIVKQYCWSESEITKGIRLGISTLLMNFALMLARLAADNLEDKTELLEMTIALLERTPPNEVEAIFRTCVAIGTLLPEHSRLRRLAKDLGLLETAIGFECCGGKVIEAIGEMKQLLKY